jgi:uncharacterized membrane protein
MVGLKALLYALAVFAALGLISLIVAVMMRIMYSILHKREKKSEPDKKLESGTVSQ